MKRPWRIFPKAGCFLLAAICLTFSAFSQPFGQTVTIDVPLFEGGEGLAFFLHCAREYERLRPDVSVDVYGDPRISDKIRIRIIDQSYPELTNADLGKTMLMSKGLLLWLDPYLDGPNWEGDSTWRESFLPGTLRIFQYQGKTYGIPFIHNVNLLWYNKKLFEEHGWHPPETWDELFQLCRDIRAAGIAPIAFQGRYIGYVGPIVDSALYQIGGLEALLNLGYLEPGWIDHPDFIQALTLVQNLALNYFQEGCMGMSHTEAQMQFFLGKAAMISCGTWLKSEMEGKIPPGFQLGAFNYPSVPGGQGDPSALNAGSGYFYVFADSPHPEKAVDFLRFMTSREMAGLFSRMRDIPTVVRGASEGNLSPDLQDAVRLIDKATIMYGREIGDVLLPGFNQYYYNHLYNLLVGRVTPEEMTANLEAVVVDMRKAIQEPDRVIYRIIWKPAVFLTLLAAAVVFVIVTQVRKVWIGLSRRSLPGNSLPSMRLVHVLLFLGPAVGLYTVFIAFPALRAFGMCVQEWDGLTEARFVGLLHFKRLLFENDFFWTAFKNNLFLMFVPSGIVLVVAMFLAASINRGVRGHRVFRIVFFFPNIMGVVAVSLLWLNIYNPQGGLMNGALVSLGEGFGLLGINSLAEYFRGFEGFAWLSQDYLYRSIIPMAIWGAGGFYMILFLAGMESIPVELYEAAKIDGANP